MRLKSCTLALGFFAIVLWLSAACAGQSSLQNKTFDESALLDVVGSLYGIDPGLLEAIATAESSNNPAAISSAGAKGLMQLMPATAWQFKVLDPFDPVQNVLGAARFLDYLKKHTGGDLPQMLAAYNAGEGAVKSHHGIPPYPETRDYVRRVLRFYLLGTRPFQQSTANPQSIDTSAADTNQAISNRSTSGDDQIFTQLDAIKRARGTAVQN